MCLKIVHMQQLVWISRCWKYLWTFNKLYTRCIWRSYCRFRRWGSRFSCCFWSSCNRLYYSSFSRTRWTYRCSKTIYGGTSNLLAHTFTQYGITTTFVDAHNLQEVEDAIQENTKAIYLETLGNPNSDIPDIDAISAIAKKHGLPVLLIIHWYTISI